MLANAELAQDFFILNQQYKRLVAALLEAVALPATPLELAASGGAAVRGLEGDRIYHVKEGSLSARYRGRAVFTLDGGDLLLPDIAGADDPAAAVSYASETGASLAGYPALEFMRRVFASTDAAKLWTRLLVTQGGMGLRLAAAGAEAEAESEAPATPGFETYGAGEIIIRQGERADFVYNLVEGSAEVFVDGVAVGGIGEGEIFGAMAVLTDAERTATVSAKTRCAVVKVPKAQFSELIKSNPATIHSLLSDMARSIVNLNEQLVSLRGSYVS